MVSGACYGARNARVELRSGPRGAVDATTTYWPLRPPQQIVRRPGCSARQHDRWSSWAPHAQTCPSPSRRASASRRQPSPAYGQPRRYPAAASSGRPVVRRAALTLALTKRGPAIARGNATATQNQVLLRHSNLLSGRSRPERAPRRRSHRGDRGVGCSSATSFGHARDPSPPRRVAPDHFPD